MSLKIAISLLLITSLTACTTNTPTAPKDPVDPALGEFVMNVPNQPHTHVVRLPGCSDKDQYITHIHPDYQSHTRLHVHKGCLQCPNPNGIQRIH
ncbi:hypothetical protein [Thiolinea disciformis]|uniref:hypothetical protein n=1 Tax=Thiolinea disciformis TaxID=125614 RepID=UPI00035C5532|nr:hypothetical protein [Thiolinea disciformis]